MTRSPHAASPPKANTSLSSGPRALLIAAERLVAEHGVAGVSIRKIVHAAGQANNSAIHHHFGGKAGLLRALLEMRMAEIDAVREGYLRRAEARGDLDVRTLVELAFKPVADLVDERGVHVYARFRRRLGEEYGHDPWGLMMTGSPSGASIIAMLSERLPHLDPAEFAVRLFLSGLLFLTAIGSADPDRPYQPVGDTREGFLDQVLSACVAVFQAPMEAAPLSKFDATRHT
jgi:AcrR family transcriptional regulator